MDEIICHLGELEGSNSAIDETDPSSQLLAHCLRKSMDINFSFKILI